MKASHSTTGAVSRRKFLASAGVLSAAVFAGAGAVSGTAFAAEAEKAKKIPIGLEMYSVRGEMIKNLSESIRAVSKMGYECIEFPATYLDWPFARAKDVRRLLDDLGLPCLSTHNRIESFTPGASMDKAIELNQILGTRSMILASAPRSAKDMEGWKNLCAQMSTAVEQLKTHGLYTGFHNHQTEWAKLDDTTRVMDVMAANTPKEFALQLDVGTCMEAGQDPVAWVKANPGRIRSVHLKDWAPGKKEDEKSYRVLFGEGTTPWKELLATVESVGGVEFYFMEQEGSRFGEFETAQKCLESWRKMRG